jgi:hypothetical protein
MGKTKATKKPREKKADELVKDEEYDYIKVPPDGGFGWVILVVCFVS